MSLEQELISCDTVYIQCYTVLEYRDQIYKYFVASVAPPLRNVELNKILNWTD